MDIVSLFRVQYLEDIGGAWVRHVAECTIDGATVDTVAALFASPDGVSDEADAQAAYHVVLDISSEPLPDDTSAVGYVIVSPDFMLGFDGTVEQRCVDLCELFRGLLTSQFACGAVTYYVG